MYLNRLSRRSCWMKGGQTEIKNLKVLRSDDECSQNSVINCFSTCQPLTRGSSLKQITTWTAHSPLTPVPGPSTPSPNSHGNQPKPYTSLRFVSHFTEPRYEITLFGIFMGYMYTYIHTRTPPFYTYLRQCPIPSLTNSSGYSYFIRDWSLNLKNTGLNPSVSRLTGFYTGTSG